MAIIETVEILERNSLVSLIKIKAGSKEALKKIYVMSGEEVERTEDSIILRVMQNDSLLINRRISLWWNQEEGTFVRQ